jgi:hypothetical protein
MKRVFSRIVLISALCCGLANATSEFRTPLSIFRGYHHYPLAQVGNTWWYDQTCDLLKTAEGHLYCPIDEKDSRKDSPWIFDTWGTGYYRGANKAFICNDDDECFVCAPDPCHDDCNANPFAPQLAVNLCEKCPDGKKRGTLSTLWFGKETFRGEQAFADSILSPTIPNINPFLLFSNIAPNFDYNEWGVYFGGHVERRLGEKRRWRVGGRVSLPFKVIEIEQNLNCEGNGIEQGLEAVIAEAPFNLDADGSGNAVDYAFRLDFLSALVRPGLPTTQNSPLVQYGTGAAPNQTKIAGIPVGFNAINASNPPIFLVKSVGGTIPPKTLVPNLVPDKFSYAKVAAGTVVLPASGAGAEASVNYFDATQNYAAALGIDRTAQGTLFVVGRIDTTNPDGTGTPTQLNSNAVAIYNAVQELIESLELSGNASAVAFFDTTCCIDLCRYERIVGLGDLEAEIYGGYGSENNRWFSNFVFGVRFPTGKNQKDPRRVYYQSTGHNGHYEIKLGYEGGWKPCKYFAFYGDLSFHHAFKHKMNKAAPFTGAAVRNIGPCVEAEVSWDYWMLHADLNFFHPRNQDLGFVIGYELFAKRNDKVELCSKTAVDCLGRTEPISPCLLEACTNSLANKIRLEAFNRWNFGELYAGMSQVVAGRNVMQESEVHIGMAIHF